MVHIYLRNIVFAKITQNFSDCWLQLLILVKKNRVKTDPCKDIQNNFL